MSNKVVWISLVVVLVVVLVLGLVFPRAPKAIVERVVEKVSDGRLGSVTGPVLDSPFFTVNGVSRWFASQGVKTATTTLCAIQAPTNATSTLVAATVQITTSTSSATTIVVAKDTTAFGTTTSIATGDIAANDRIDLFTTATTSPIQNANSGVIPATSFAPGDYLTVGWIGADSGGDDMTGLAPAGACRAEWQSHR